MRLSGTYHPVSYLLKRISDYVPGVLEINALWLNDDKKIYFSEETTPIHEDLKIKAQALRNSKSHLEWQSHAHFFEVPTTNRTQLSLEDEDKLNTLWIYIKSPIDGLKDIIAITFQGTLFLKSMNIEFQGMSTQEKHILGRLLYSILSADYEKVIEERKILNQFAEINQQREKKIQLLENHLKVAETHYSSAVREIVQDLIQKHENYLKKNFVLSNDIILKLAKERVSFLQIENIIKDAVYLAYHLNLNQEIIHVTTDYLPIKTQEFPKLLQSETVKDKVIDLLDRYEEAAQKVANKGLTINGKNIAAHLDPPVTPPAITDAVKKNQKKISYFLKQYPNNWIKTRKTIRPINNLDENQPITKAI